MNRRLDVLSRTAASAIFPQRLVNAGPVPSASGMFAFLLALAASDAVATTRTFPGVPPCTTLQACINGSSAGDTIIILSGTYSVPEINVSKALVLSGTGVGLVTLQPDAAHRVLITGQNLAGVTLSNLTVQGGSCVGAQTGGGIFADVGTPLTLTNVDVRNNTCAGNSGGGIFVSADATLTNVNVVDNTDPGGAGGGLRASGNVTISGGRFEHNISFNPGGAMRVNGTLAMTAVGVLNNSNTAAGTNGGGIRADGGLLLSGGTIKDNHAANQGGGIFATSAVIISATIQTNSATQGGGICTTGALTVTDTLFDGNTATTAMGGAIYSGGLLTATGSTLNNNQAVTGGGAIGTAGALDIATSTFSGNLATGPDADGGAILSGSGLATLTDVVLSANNASHSGGGASLRQAMINRTMFINNATTNPTLTSGGGLRLRSDSEIRSSIFQGNQSSTSGALHAEFSDQTHTLSVLDSLFFDNRQTSDALSAGADMRVFDLAMTLVNNTFGRPGAPSASVLILRSLVDARNNIFSGYQASLRIFDTNTTVVTEDYNDFFNAPFSVQVVSGGHSLTSDPQFSNSAGGNFRVKPGSPVIDAGDKGALPGNLTEDLDGLERYTDLATKPDTGVGPPPVVDMGAFEFHDVIFRNGFDVEM